MNSFKLIIADDYSELSRQTAQMISAFIQDNPNSLLCLAAGDTPLGTFAQLIKMQETGEVNLSSVYYAGLDEWVGLGQNDKGSCKQVMFDNFYTPARIPPARIHVFDGLKDPDAECRAMNQWLADKGPLALALLGVGMNGHVGFNEPNGPDCDGAIVVPLDEVTKAVSVKYFGKEIPVTIGVTIGLSTLQKAQKVLVMASGEKKASVIKAAFFDAPTLANPASMLQTHSGLVLLLDKAAKNVNPTPEFDTFFHRIS